MRVPQVSERIKEAPAQALRGVFAGIGQLLLVTDKLRHKTPAGAGVPRTRTPEPAGTPAAAQGEPAADSSSAIATAAAPKEAVAETAAAETAVAETPVVVEVVVAEATEPAVVELVAAKPLVAEPAAATALVAEPVATEPLVAEPVAAKPAPAKAARTTARKPAKKPPARDFDKTGNVRLLAGEEDAEAAAAEIPAVPAETTPPLPNYDELSIASLRARLRNLDIAQLKQVADYERSHAGRAEVIAMFERRVAKLEAEPEAGA
jgi:hypothetical protein